jgi:hypothetical protein
LGRIVAISAHLQRLAPKAVTGPVKRSDVRASLVDLPQGLLIPGVGLGLRRGERERQDDASQSGEQSGLMDAGFHKLLRFYWFNGSVQKFHSLQRQPVKTFAPASDRRIIIVSINYSAKWN